ncbi:MAG: chemotaxis protein CheB, partial [Rhodanobacter sp.]
MVESGPAVALLYDDSELGDQLRVVLQEHGARIVHEGSAVNLDREHLRQCDVDVVVINLDSDDDAFDHLYDLIESDRPRVVFNDGQVSRSLKGWDRARWVRHLVAKVMASSDV